MINTVVLMGRITAVPELRMTQSEIPVVQIRVAVDRRYSKQGAEKQADFIPVVAWRNTAEFIAKYFGKGDMIAVTGSLQSREYEDKNGNRRIAYEVIADSASFCGAKKEGGQVSVPAPAPNPPQPENRQLKMGEQIPDDDDLPF